MLNLIWRPLTTTLLKVPEPQNAGWTPVLDFILINRIYKISVKDNSKWMLDNAPAECTTDGAEFTQRAGDPVCKGTPYGALIAKIGGSTADTNGTIFAVGRYCVFQITEAEKLGPLYLGANDKFELMSKVIGQIEVEIEIAL